MLERQVITMPFAQGVDTKTDEKQVAAGKLLELENGVFTTLKAIRKRDGYVALGASVSGSLTQKVDSGAGLATYGNELLLADGQSIYSYDQGANNWTDKGGFISTQVAKASVVRDTHSQKNPSGAVADNGIQCYAWEDSSGGTTTGYCVRYSLIDSSTSQTVVASELLATDSFKPRVIALGNRFFIYFIDVTTAELKVAFVLATTPQSAPTFTTLTGVSPDADAVSSSSPNYDVGIIPDQGVCVAYNNRDATLGTTVRMYGLIDPLAYTAQYVIPYLSRSISVFPTMVFVASQIQGPTVVFSTDDNISPSTDIRFYSFSFSPSVLNVEGSGIIHSGYPDPKVVMLISGCSPDSQSRGFTVFYGTQSGASSFAGGQKLMRKAEVDDSYAVLPSTFLRYWLNPVSKAFAYNGYAYVLVGHVSQLQTAYFIMRDDGMVVGKALYGTAGSYPSVYDAAPYTAGYVMPLPANVTQIDANTFVIPVLEQANLAGAGFTTQTGVSSLSIDFDEPRYSYDHETLGNNLHFSGGIVQMYDGIGVVEHNFNLYPEGIIGGAAIASGGSVGPGTYQYVACYEWTDNQNNIHRSSPSPAIEVVVAVPNNSVTVSVKSLPLTQKVGDRPVQIVLYRTTNAGSILYRVSSLTAPTLNNVAAQQANISDTLADSSLEVNGVAAAPLLYSQFISGTVNGTGYDLPNFPAPPTGIVQLHRNRLWVVDSTNPLQLWYSKADSIGAPVEFTEDFVKQVDPRGGPITALASVDDKLLVFKRSHTFVIVGQGPDATGANNDLSDAIFVTSDVGCIDPRSVVGTPIGIMFQTAKGIYLIDRSLQVQYVGSPVEAYNNETITSATLMPSVNQVRFTLQSGKTLVYDYFVQQWGVFTGQYAVDSLVWLETTVLLRSNGIVLRETPGVWNDAGAPYSLKLTTAWMTFANIQGFQRVRRAQILGAWKSPHNLAVDVYVDFNNTSVQSMTVTPQTPQVYGGVSPYGAGLYGGEFQLYQWRIDLARQKNQAVKFTIRDLPTATAGEGMSLSSIAFEVGAKQGVAKVPKAQIFS